MLWGHLPPEFSFAAAIYCTVHVFLLDACNMYHYLPLNLLLLFRHAGLGLTKVLAHSQWVMDAIKTISWQNDSIVIIFQND